MQITWELFEIVKGLAKYGNKHQDIFILKVSSTTDLKRIFSMTF